jgi:hypothetical protein
MSLDHIRPTALSAELRAEWRAAICDSLVDVMVTRTPTRTRMGRRTPANFAGGIANFAGLGAAMFAGGCSKLCWRVQQTLLIRLSSSNKVLVKKVLVVRGEA